MLHATLLAHADPPPPPGAAAAAAAAAAAVAATSAAAAAAATTSTGDTAAVSTAHYQEIAFWTGLRGRGAVEAAWVGAMAAAGARCDGLRLAAVSGGRGLVAARPLREHEDVCELPVASALTKTTLVLSSLGEGLMQAFPFLTVNDLAALFLLRETERRRSEWKAYAAILAGADGADDAGPDDLGDNGGDDKGGDGTGGGSGDAGGGAARRRRRRRAFVPPEGMPAAWDPATAEGAARLRALSRHGREIAATLRDGTLERHERAFGAQGRGFERFALVLSEGGVCSGTDLAAAVPHGRRGGSEGGGGSGGGDGGGGGGGGGEGGGGQGVCSGAALRRIYSAEAFLDASLLLRSRSFGIVTPSAGQLWLPWFDLVRRRRRNSVHPTAPHPLAPRPPAHQPARRRGRPTTRTRWRRGGRCPPCSSGTMSSATRLS